MNIEPLEAALVSDRLMQTTLPDGSGVLLDLDGQQVLTLNDTGVHLVERLRSGAGSTSALVEGMTAEFDVDAEAAEADIETFVLDLARFLKIAV